MELTLLQRRAVLGKCVTEFKLRGGTDYENFHGAAIKLALFYVGWLYVHHPDGMVSNKAGVAFALDRLVDLKDEDGNLVVATVIGEYSPQHGCWESLTPGQLKLVTMYFRHGMAWAARELFSQPVKARSKVAA